MAESMRAECHLCSAEIAKKVRGKGGRMQIIDIGEKFRMTGELSRKSSKLELASCGREHRPRGR